MGASSCCILYCMGGSGSHQVHQPRPFCTSRLRAHKQSPPHRIKEPRLPFFLSPGQSGPWGETKEQSTEVKRECIMLQRLLKSAKSANKIMEPNVKLLVKHIQRAHAPGLWNELRLPSPPWGSNPSPRWDGGETPMGILGYNKRNMLEQTIKKRLAIVFGSETTPEKIDQAGTNIINIFEQFLEECFA